jgi:hypothetical protein
MDPVLQTVINIGAVATALAAIIGVLVAIIKLWPHVKRGVTVLSELERLPEIASSVETIRHELFPNSGLSLRDQTNRLEKQGEKMAKKLDDHIAACPPAAPTTTINVNPGGQQ